MFRARALLGTAQSRESCGRWTLLTGDSVSCWACCWQPGGCGALPAELGVTLSQHHVPVSLQHCPCLCPLLASCLLAATPIRASARNARKALRSGGTLLPLLPGISCSSCYRKHNQLGSPCFNVPSQGRTVQVWSQAGPFLAALCGGELEGRVAGRHQHQWLLSVLLTICNQAKTWERAAGARQEGCGCFADGESREILQSPEMGVADRWHTGGMAAARVWGEQDLGNPKVLSSLL